MNFISFIVILRVSNMAAPMLPAGPAQTPTGLKGHMLVQQEYAPRVQFRQYRVFARLSRNNHQSVEMEWILILPAPAFRLLLEVRRFGRSADLSKNRAAAGISAAYAKRVRWILRSAYRELNKLLLGSVASAALLCSLASEARAACVETSPGVYRLLGSNPGWHSNGSVTVNLLTGGSFYKRVRISRDLAQAYSIMMVSCRTTCTRCTMTGFTLNNRSSISGTIFCRAPASISSATRQPQCPERRQQRQ